MKFVTENALPFIGFEYYCKWKGVQNHGHGQHGILCCLLYISLFLLSTNLGKISEPCCISAPSANQRVFENENAFDCSFEDVVCCHSYGLHRPTTKRTMLTPRNARTTHTQTLVDSGFMKEKTPGFTLSGFLIIMLIPTFMNGLVKSTTRCLSSFIVSDERAIWAFWQISK